MKRLLSSSKFQASLAGVLACVLVACLNMTEENADQLSALLMKLIAGITAFYSVATAAEDMASKRAVPTITRESATSASIARPDGFTRGVPKVLTLLLLGSALLVGNVACSTFDPGGQTARAMNQRFNFGWDTNSNFTADGDGSQTGGFTMAEGDLVLREDGTPDPAASRVTSYLTYSPKADATRDAFAMAYQQSSLQMQMQLNTINQLMNIIGARVGVSVGADGSYVPPAASPATESKLDRLLGLLEQQVRAPTPSKTK